MQANRQIDRQTNIQTNILNKNDRQSNGQTDTNRQVADRLLETE